MFQRDRCDLCGDCLVECQWMEIGREQAVAWMQAMIAGEKVPVLGRCITCYACNEICPRDARPFDLIAELQEKYRSLSSAESAQASEARYVFDKELAGYPRAERVMSACVFGKSDANLIQGEFYDLPIVSGKPYFCWVLMSHLGAESLQRKHAGELVERLARTGAKEVVCFHDDCYAMLARLAPDYGIEVPFRPVHLSEHLVRGLNARRERIQPLHIRVAYQRPCASRHTPEKEHFIDELFELAGVERVQRAYDRERALCCAGIKMALGQGDPRPDQEKNILDAKNAGAEALACLCPMCMHSLSAVAKEHDLPLIFIGDLARMAIGEIAPSKK
jgi:Fe-S oxidoreductase